MTPRPGSRAHALEVVRRLAEAYGPRPWRRHHPPVDELVTTVLSQSTTDANQHRAFAALKAAFPDWDAVRTAPVERVAAAIRPAGLAVQKAPRIQRILDRAAEEPRGPDLEWLGRVPLDEAMGWLTALDGVGPKTAACVLCFSFDRHVLPVDTHVHRIALRLRLVPPRSDPAAHPGPAHRAGAGRRDLRHPHAPGGARPGPLPGPGPPLPGVSAARSLPGRAPHPAGLTAPRPGIAQMS